MDGMMGRMRRGQCFSLVFEGNLGLDLQLIITKFDSWHLHAEGEFATAVSSSWLDSDSTTTALYYMLYYVEAETDTTAVLLRGSMHFAELQEQFRQIFLFYTFACVFHAYLQAGGRCVVDDTYYDASLRRKPDCIFDQVDKYLKQASLVAHKPS